MFLSNITLTNWRNFTEASFSLGETTTYIIGPNASGKSNLLDVLRFMRDIAKPQGGGLQQAMASRGGISKIRCLAARRNPAIRLEFKFIDEKKDDTEITWRYILEVKSEGSGRQRPIVNTEEVFRGDNRILHRPNSQDRADTERLLQTHLESTSDNQEFRAITEFFANVLYLHLVPQLLKYSDQLLWNSAESDPFGQRFLEEVSKTQKKTRGARLSKIGEVLGKVIPNLSKLEFEQDEVTGRPHLKMRYEHWRSQGAWQREDQFSDGTLRLIGMLWTLLSANRTILLEEPELSLHTAVVRQIPDIIRWAQRERRKPGAQVLISTHSEVMLSETSIDGTFLILSPGEKGEATRIEGPSGDDSEAMRAGLSAADVLLPKTATSVKGI